MKKRCKCKSSYSHLNSINRKELSRAELERRDVERARKAGHPIRGYDGKLVSPPYTITRRKVKN